MASSAGAGFPNQNLTFVTQPGVAAIVDLTITATDSGVILGDDNILREYVTIHRSMYEGQNTVLGSGNFLMTNAHLAHDVQTGDGNVVGSNVVFAGHIEP